jgi:hypothetical protein
MFSVRFLSSDLAEESAKRIAAEDKIRELQAKLIETQEELIRARAETLDAVRHVADWMSQSLFGRKIYANAPDLPEKPTQPSIIHQKPQARRLVNQLEQEFFSKFDEPTQ